MTELEHPSDASRDSAPAALRVVGGSPRLDVASACAPSQLKSETIGQIAAFYASFAKNLTTSLAVLLHSDLLLSVEAVDEMNFAQARQGMTAPGCLAAFSLGANSSPLILDLGNSFAMALVELLLGGSAGAVEANRELTEIEKHLLVDVIEAFAGGLTRSLAHLGIAVVLQSIETNPARLKAIAEGDSVTIITLSSQIGEENWRLRIIQPTDFAETLCGSHSRPESHQESRQPGLPLELMERCQVGLEVQLSVPDVGAKELIGLKPGDVLHLDRALSIPVEAHVNGAPVLSGHVAILGKKRAFIVDRVLD